MTISDQPTRRDFLHGRAVVQLLGNVAKGLIDELPPTAAAGSTTASPGSDASASATVSLLTSYRRRAMACEFEVQLAAASATKAVEPVLTALDLVETLERQLSVYRDDTEIARINREAAERPIVVEERLFALLEMASRLHRETGGALDLTTNPLSAAWGFSRRQGRMPTPDEIAVARRRMGMEKVILNAADHTVAFSEQGVSLHLNCIGKGYALDRMSETLANSGIGDYLMHGGRSSILALGQAPRSSRPGWTIGLPHPLRPGERLGEIDLVDQALGTSGFATQSFEHDGRRYGHLLDPRTGQPVTGIYTATVIAPTAAEADALSTACYVMGPLAAARCLAKRPDLGAILVCPDHAGDNVRLETFRMDDSRWRPLMAVDMGRS
jgi:thiamine biosynthesis lipoprotein